MAGTVGAFLTGRRESEPRLPGAPRSAVQALPPALGRSFCCHARRSARAATKQGRPNRRQRSLQPCTPSRSPECRPASATPPKGHQCARGRRALQAGHRGAVGARSSKQRPILRPRALQRQRRHRPADPRRRPRNLAARGLSRRLRRRSGLDVETPWAVSDALHTRIGEPDERQSRRRLRRSQPVPRRHATTRVGPSSGVVTNLASSSARLAWAALMAASTPGTLPPPLWGAELDSMIWRAAFADADLGRLHCLGAVLTGPGGDVREAVVACRHPVRRGDDIGDRLRLHLL